MSAGVITIGKRHYAVGLYWENSPSGRISQAAKEAAQQQGQQADFYAVRPGNKNGRIPQFGLGQAAVGHKLGQPVLAACLANQQPGSWAGAFRLREGTVIVIVRDDLIVPDGDLFFLDEGEARDRLLQEMSFGGLQRVYAPEAWGIPGADSMPLTLLLSDRSDVRLRPVSIPKKVLVALGVGATLLTLALGIGLYIQDQNEKEELARLARLEALRQAQEQLKKMAPKIEKPVEYPPPERRWEKMPPALSVVEACRAGLARVPMTVPGWRLENVRCDGRSLSANWKKSANFVTLPPNLNMDEAGTGASLSVQLPSLPARGHEDLMKQDDLTRRILAQNWPGQQARDKADAPPPAPPDFYGAWDPPPPPWIKRSFTLPEPVLPWTLSAYLADLPGVVINFLEYKPNGLYGTWTVDGVIYENRR